MRLLLILSILLLFACTSSTKTEIPAERIYPITKGNWSIPSPVEGKWGGVQSNNKVAVGDTVIVNDTTDYAISVYHDSTSTADLADRRFSFSITDSSLNGLEYDFFLPNEIILTLPNFLVEEIQDQYLSSGEINEIQTDPNYVKWTSDIRIRKCLETIPLNEQLMELKLQDEEGLFRLYQIDVSGFLETVNYILCDV